MLEATASKVRYIGNGVATEFAFPFRVWEASQVAVYVGDGEFESEVSSSCDIAVTDTGGTVTFSTAPAEGTVIVIMRDMPYTQEDDYENGARFNGNEVEDRFDMDCAERQDLRRDIDRAVKAPVTSSADGAQFVEDIYQARKDALEALETLGGAQAIMDARDAVLDALRDAGDVTGATLVTATGTSAARSAADRFADVVNVRDYGAKGDGSTAAADVARETAAIQAAADAALYKRLSFPAGRYVINDTIHLSSADVDLGGSAIVWDGEVGGTMLHYDGCSDNGSTRKSIRNGIVNGMWKAANGLVLDCIWITASDMYVKDCTADNIAIGHAPAEGETRRSMSCHISHVIVQCGANAEHGSNLNSARGLAIYEADNKIDDLNVVGCNKSVYAKTPGNMFSNCHFCAVYKNNEKEETIGTDYAVYLDYYENSGLYANIFSNCYFDNHKYVFYSNTSSTQRVICSNSMYYNSGNQHTGTSFYSAHMLGGNAVCLSVENFTIRQSSYCRFFDAALSSAPSMLMSAMIKERYAKCIDSGASGRQLPYMAQYHVMPEDNVAVVRTGTTIASGAYFCIGCIVLPNTDSISRFTGATITLADRSAGKIVLKVWYDGGWECSSEILGANSNIGLAVGEPESIAVDSHESLMLPLYLHAGANISGAVMYANARADGYARCYLCGDVAAAWTSQNYVVDVGGAVPQGRHAVYATLSQLGLTTSSTLLQVCSAMPNSTTGAFYLNSGSLYSSLPGETTAGSGKSKYLRIVKSGNGVCACECFGLSSGDTTLYITFVNTASPGTVYTWQTLSNVEEA